MERIAWLVAHSDRLQESMTMPPSRLYPILIHPGIGDLLALQCATALASGTDFAALEHCERLLRTMPAEILNPPPLLTGDDLIALGWQPGPVFKTVLEVVRSAQLDRSIRDRPGAIELANATRGK